MKSTGFTLGDDITINEQWSALIGINYTEIILEDVFKDNHDANETTPSIALVYKPTGCHNYLR